LFRQKVVPLLLVDEGCHSEWYMAHVPFFLEGQQTRFSVILDESFLIESLWLRKKDASSMTKGSCPCERSKESFTHL